MANLDYDLSSIQEARDKARQGLLAAKKMNDLSDQQIDKIIRNMIKVAEENALMLGRMAVEDTGFGKAEDKAYKNHMASTLLYESIKNNKVRGIIGSDPSKKILTVAHPVGLILGLVPSTNPTATVIYNSIIAIMAGNTILFSPHPTSVRSTSKTAELMAKAAEEAGAPKGVIDCIQQVSMEATNELMKGQECSLIIATGGPGMVKAAYSSGKPAIGVGAGNSPAYIERTANVKEAVEKIVTSKVFDYGTICASEQSIVCEKCNEKEVVEQLEKNHCYFLNEEELQKVCNSIFYPGTTTMAADCVGRSAQDIADKSGITIPKGTKILIGRQDGIGKDYPLSYEKLTSVLGFYVVEDWKEACIVCYGLLEHGFGHTLSIHTEDPEIVLKFAVKPASRIIVNSGGGTGGAGLTTGLQPAFTLGCGTCGGSSVSENVGPQHLINIKKIAFGIKDPRTVIQEDQSFHAWNENQSNVTKEISDEEIRRIVQRVMKDLQS